MTPEMAAYLAGPSITTFTAVQVVLPSGTVRLLDGSADLTFSGVFDESGAYASASFTGRDPTYGVLAGVEEFEEAVGTEAPRWRCLVSPPDTAAVALWTDPTVQGSEVRVWTGGVDTETGLVIVDPELQFVGELDVPVIRFGFGESVIELDAASPFERLFAVDEGHKLNDAFHQSVYPGEKGFEYVTGVQRQLYWGHDAPPDAAVRTLTPRLGAGVGSNLAFLAERLRSL